MVYTKGQDAWNKGLLMVDRKKIKCNICEKEIEIKINSLQKYCSLSCSNKARKGKLKSPRKGKTYEEIFGIKKAKKLKLHLSKINTGKGHPHNKKTKKKLSKIAKKNKLGGHTSKQKIYYKNIQGEIFYLQSSYELIFAKSMNKQKIYWVRPKPIKWIDKNKEWHWYYPDFYIPKTNTYYDTKNDYLIKKDKDKIQRVRKQNNINLIILDKNHLNYMPS